MPRATATKKASAAGSRGAHPASRRAAPDTFPNITAQQARDASARVAHDHGRRVHHIAGVAVVDATRDFPLDTAPKELPAGLNITGIGQHHDAGSYPDDPLPGDDFDAEMARMDAVYAMHRANGWGGIAYHLYAFPSGRLYMTRPLWLRACGVAWRNHELYASVVAGDWTATPPPIGAQLAAAMSHIVLWATVGRLLPIKGHREWALSPGPDGKNWATACPGDAFTKWVPKLPAAIAAIVPQLRA
jgi:hypothetical protein